MKLTSEEIWYEKGDLCVLGANVHPFEKVNDERCHEQQVTIDAQSPVVCLHCFGFLNPYCEVNIDSSWVCVLCNTHNPPITDMKSTVGVVSDSISVRRYLAQYCKELQEVPSQQQQPAGAGFVSTFTTHSAERLPTAASLMAGGSGSTWSASTTYVLAIDASLVTRGGSSECELRELFLPALAAIDDSSSRVSVLVVVLHSTHMSILRLNEYCIEQRSSTQQSAASLSAYYCHSEREADRGGVGSSRTVISVDICPAVSDGLAATIACKTRSAQGYRLRNDQSVAFGHLFSQSLYAASKDDAILYFESILSCVQSVAGDTGTGGYSDSLCSVSAVVGLVNTIHTSSGSSGALALADVTGYLRLIMVVGSPPSACVNAIPRHAQTAMGIGGGGGDGSDIGASGEGLQHIRHQAEHELMDLHDYECLGRLALECNNCFIDMFYVNNAIISNTTGLLHMVQLSGGQLVTAERLSDASLMDSFTTCLGMPSSQFPHLRRPNSDQTGTAVKFITSGNLRPVAFPDAARAVVKTPAVTKGGKANRLWAPMNSPASAAERLTGGKIVGGDVALGSDNTSSRGGGVLRQQQSSSSSSSLVLSSDPASRIRVMAMQSSRNKHHLLSTVTRANQACGRKTAVDDTDSIEKLTRSAQDCLVHWDRKLITLAATATDRNKTSSGSSAANAAVSTTTTNNGTAIGSFMGAIDSLALLREEFGSDEEGEETDDCEVDFGVSGGSSSGSGGGYTGSGSGVGAHCGKYFQEMTCCTRRPEHASFSILLKPRRVLRLPLQPLQLPAGDGGTNTVDSLTDEVEGGARGGPSGSTDSGLNAEHSTSFGYVQCSVSYLLQDNVTVTRIFTRQITIKYATSSASPSFALKTQTAPSAIVSRAGNGANTNDGVVTSLPLSLLLARHLVHQYAADVLLAPLLHCEHYYRANLAQHQERYQSSSLQLLPRGLSISFHSYLLKHARTHYCGVVDNILRQQKVVSGALWKTQSGGASAGGGVVDVAGIAAATTAGSSISELFRTCRFYHHLREGPLLGSAALHPSECHRQCWLFLHSFHADSSSNSSVSSSPNVAPSPMSCAPSSVTSTSISTTASILESVSVSASLRMIEPALYLLFPDTIDRHVMRAAAQAQAPTPTPTPTEPPVEIGESSSASSKDDGGTTATSSTPNVSKGAANDSTSAGVGAGASAGAVNIASLLTRYPPDSIYLASEHTLGVVDLGDRVVVWVGRYYAAAAATAKATTASGKDSSQGDAASNRDKRLLRNSGCTKVVTLVHKLLKYARHIAGIIGTGRVRGTCTEYPCAQRYPAASVSMIIQGSPNSRLLFTRLASAHNDSKFLLHRYIDPGFYHTAVRIAYQLRTTAASDCATTGAAVREKAAGVDGVETAGSDDDAAALSRFVESDEALAQFMDEVAYLPPTDTPSFMRHLAELAPGVIQQCSKERENTVSGDRQQQQQQHHVTTAYSSSKSTPPPPPSSSWSSSVLDIFTVFPPPPHPTGTGTGTESVDVQEAKSHPQPQHQEQKTRIIANAGGDCAASELSLLNRDSYV